MDASDTPAGETDSAAEAHITITPPLPGDTERVTGRFRCEAPDDWVASGVLSRTWRGLAITELTVEPWTEIDNEPGHITSKLLRKIPTGAIIAAAQSAGLAGDTAAPVEPPALKRQPGRQPLSDDLLRDIAEAYLRETAPGMPRGSITRLAEQYGKPKPMIARWVMRARGDGWLGPAAPGREGGEPGPRLVAARQPAEPEIPPLTDAQLRDVAETYVRQAARGNPEDVLARVGEHFGKPVPVVAAWVAQARESGWLAPDGVELGPHLLAVYAQEKATFESARDATDPFKIKQETGDYRRRVAPDFRWKWETKQASAPEKPEE